MTKTEYKALLFQFLDCEVDGLTYEERMQLSETYLVEYQIKQEDRRERPNRRKPWTDEELRVVLMDAPTKRNCIKYAKIFSRGYGSIEEIYRWASTDDKTVQEKRPNDVFMGRVKKIAKELGWPA